MTRVQTCLMALLPLVVAGIGGASEPNDSVQPLAGTRPLTWTGDLAERIVEVFLDTPFEGGRHGRRVQKIEISPEEK